MYKMIFLLFSVLLSATAMANEVAVAPSVKADGLPPLGAEWLENNPYRGNALAVDIGRQAYNQACARCHGANASTNAAPAPDLRNLNRYCRRIGEAELRAACMRDNDAYFANVVRKGKVIVGITHMPPWEGVLQQELAWAIQTFFEAQAGGGRE
jgi:cytochrome c5